MHYISLWAHTHSLFFEWVQLNTQHVPGTITTMRLCSLQPQIFLTETATQFPFNLRLSLTTPSSLEIQHLTSPMVSGPLDRFCFPSYHLGINDFGDQTFTLFPSHSCVSAPLTSLSSQTAPVSIIKVSADRTTKPHPGSLEACRKDQEYIFCDSRIHQKMN